VIRSMAPEARASDRVVSGRVGAATVLFHLDDRSLHFLNETAGALWAGLAGPEPVDETVSRLVDWFGADRSVVERDLRDLVDRLQAGGLVAGVDAGNGPALTGPARIAPNPSMTRKPETGSFGALATNLVVETDDSELARIIDDVLSPLRSPAPAPFAIRVDVLADGRCEVVTHLGERAVVANRVAAVMRVVGEVNAAAVESVPDRLVLHAGAVAGSDGAVVLPAGSGSGKSTLTAGLVGSGLRYLTDEAAAISPGGVCHPYAKAIGLDPGSFAVHPELTPTGSSGLASAVDAVAWHVAPARLGPIASPTEISAVVFPSWRAGADTVLVPCSPKVAVRRLVADAFDFGRGGQPVFDILCDLADRLPAWTLTYSDGGQAVSALRELVGESNVGPRPLKI